MLFAPLRRLWGWCAAPRRFYLRKRLSLCQRIAEPAFFRVAANFLWRAEQRTSFRSAVLSVIVCGEGDIIVVQFHPVNYVFILVVNLVKGIVFLEFKNHVNVIDFRADCGLFICGRRNIRARGPSTACGRRG